MGGRWLVGYGARGQVAGAVKLWRSDVWFFFDRRIRYVEKEISMESDFVTLGRGLGTTGLGGLVIAGLNGYSTAHILDAWFRKTRLWGEGKYSGQIKLPKDRCPKIGQEKL